MVTHPRLPSLKEDGWELDDGEARHRENPTTFDVPSVANRAALYSGALAKLIFRIATDDGAKIERMWVVVRERGEGWYLGVLDNDPYCLEENDRLWSGVELPFEPRHIIAIDNPSEATMAVAQGPLRRRWI